MFSQLVSRPYPKVKTILDGRGSYNDLLRIRKYNIWTALGHSVAAFGTFHLGGWYLTPFFVYIASGKLSALQLTRKYWPSYVSQIDIEEHDGEKLARLYIGKKRQELVTDCRNLYSLITNETMIERLKYFNDNKSESELRLFIKIKDLSLVQDPMKFAYLQNDYLVATYDRNNPDDRIELGLVADMLFGADIVLNDATDR